MLIGQCNVLSYKTKADWSMQRNIISGCKGHHNTIFSEKKWQEPVQNHMCIHETKIQRYNCIDKEAE